MLNFLHLGKLILRKHFTSRAISFQLALQDDVVILRLDGFTFELAEEYLKLLQLLRFIMIQQGPVLRQVAPNIDIQPTCATGDNFGSRRCFTLGFCQHFLQHCWRY